MSTPKKKNRARECIQVNVMAYVFLQNGGKFHLTNMHATKHTTFNFQYQEPYQYGKIESYVNNLPQTSVKVF